MCTTTDNTIKDSRLPVMYGETYGRGVWSAGGNAERVGAEVMKLCPSLR